MKGAGSSPATRIAFALLLVLLLALLAWLLRPSGVLRTEKSSGQGEEAAILPAPALSAAGAAPDRTLAAAPASAEAAVPAELSAPPLETRIFGTLLDSQQQPIRASWYAFVSITGRDGVRRNADVDEEGNYSITGLALGSYWISALAEGYRETAERIELLPETPVLRKDFILSSALLLRIRLTTPQGGDLFDALHALQAPYGASFLLPVATLENPGARFTEEIGSRNEHYGVGNFWDYGPRFSALPPGYFGILTVAVDPPVWVSLLHHQLVLESQRVEPGQEEVTFVVAAEDLVANLASVHLQVVEADTGLPLPDVVVGFTGGNMEGRGFRTDAEGKLAVDACKPGRFGLRIQSTGYAKHRSTIDVAPGAVTDLGTIALEAELTVAGLVFDAENRPRAQEFTLGLVDAADGSIQWTRDETFKSQSDGSFRIHGLARREYAIRSSNQADLNLPAATGVIWVSGIVPCDLRSGSLSALDIRLRPAAQLVLQVAGGLGDRLRFRVLDASGRDLVASRFYGSHPRPLLLPAGDYRVLLLDSAGRTLSEKSATLGTATVHLELSP